MDAGKKVEAHDAQFKVLEWAQGDLCRQLDDFEGDTRDVEYARLLEMKFELEETVAAVTQTHDAFRDFGDWRYKFVRAQDYDDRLSDRLCRFFCARSVGATSPGSCG